MVRWFGSQDVGDVDVFSSEESEPGHSINRNGSDGELVVVLWSYLSHRGLVTVMTRYARSALCVGD